MSDAVEPTSPQLAFSTFAISRQSRQSVCLSDVGAVLRRQRDRLLPVRRAAHDLDVANRRQQALDPCPDERVVFGKEDADRMLEALQSKEKENLKKQPKKAQAPVAGGKDW